MASKERKFRNPYNFIPLARPSQIALEGPLGHAAPAGHDRFHDDLWSGRIRIRIKTVTPLLIPDASRAYIRPGDEQKKSEQQHWILPLRMDGDKPLLAVTSLKGALRSAYEAVTNSRLGVFEAHDKIPTRRFEMSEAADLVPARVTDDGQSFQILTGTETLKTLRERGASLPAAWMDRYIRNHPKKRPADHAPKIRDSDAGAKAHLPNYGDQVRCRLQLEQHRRGFRYWKVVDVSKCDHADAGDKGRDKGEKYSIGDQIEASGWIFASNPNADNKHYERVFFSVGPPTYMALHETVKAHWRELVEEYQKRHTSAVEQRRRQGEKPDRAIGRNQGELAFSWHVLKQGAEHLSPGTLCYVRISNGEVVGAYPVAIGRETGAAAPRDLVPEVFQPAESIGSLSPADRVFGWVDQGRGRRKRGDFRAFKGCLRLHSLDCTDPKIERFDPPLALPILSTPKINQGKFYLGDQLGDNAGAFVKAQRNGRSLAEGFYAPNKSLRGRKVYPHHAVGEQVNNYWDAAIARRESSADPQRPPDQLKKRYYREYVRRSGPDAPNQDGQNRSIEAWVAPGAEFTGEIDVTNLSDAELGALIWLLHLPHLAGEDGTPHHRLGLGKPLGFGSVQIEITGVELRTGQAMRAGYAALFDAPNLSEPGARVIEAHDSQAVSSAAAEVVAAYQSAVVEGYTPDGKGSFEDVPFIAAFLRATRGYADGLPHHYPRVSEAPDPAGENFKWFMANQGKRGKKLSLPDLVKDDGFPYDP